MKLKPVKSNLDILAFLNTLGQHLNSEEGLTLPAEFAAKVLDLNASIRTVFEALEREAGRETELRRQHRELQQELEELVRYTQTELKSRSRRRPELRGRLAQFGLRMDGSWPRNVQTRRPVAERARLMLQADNDLRAENIVAMDEVLNSDMSMVVAELEQAQFAAQQTSNQVKQLRTQLAKLREQFALLYRNIVTFLRTELYDQPQSRVRDIMRSYGFRFTPRPGEAPDVLSDEPDADGEAADEPSVGEGGAGPVDSDLPVAA